MHDNLMNDYTLDDFALLLITEPNNNEGKEGRIFVAPSYHNRWHQLLPMTSHAQWPLVRSILWIRKGVAARPVDTNSPDLTAVLLQEEGRNILALSVYVEQKNSAEDVELNRILDEIRDVIYSTRRDIHEGSNLS